MMKNTFFLAAFGLCVSTGLCEVLTTYASCVDSDQDWCTIDQVSVTPCSDAARGKPCKLRKGHDAEIHFDFTPNFDAEKLTQRAYSAGFVDLPLIGMETDGCKFTPCPLVSGQKYSYNFNLSLSSGYPTGSYNVKWRLWDTDEDTKECCFVFKIKLLAH